MEQATEAMTPEALSAPRNPRRLFPALLLFAAVVCAAYLALCAYASFSSRLWSGSRILAQEVGGLTVEEAADALDKALPTLEISVYLHPAELSAPREEGRDAAIPLSALSLTVDSAALAQHAWETQRGSFFQSGARFLLSRVSHETDFLLPGALTVDPAAAAEAAAQCARALSWEKEDASYALIGEQLTFSAPKDGRIVSSEVLFSALESLDWCGDLTLDASYIVSPAAAITAQALHDQLAGEMENARYDAEHDTIVPERIGVSFDATAVQALMDELEGGETTILPAAITLPTVTAKELESVLFRDVLGECSTRVSGTAARRNNVALAAAAFHNTVLNAGDVFSYNETVGQRTAERGYQAAPAYIKGETVDEIGGGVCQPSSTLYLACLRANMEITQRVAHRYTPSYIPWGMDATVSWGGPDYQFTNNTAYPVRIVTKYEKNTLTVTLLGTNPTGITARVSNEVLSTTPHTVVYEEDPTLAPGTETQKTSPYDGAVVRTYRHLYDADGALISSTYEATSNYKVRNRVMLRGPALSPEVPGGEIPGEEVPTGEASGESPTGGETIGDRTPGGEVPAPPQPEAPDAPAAESAPLF